MNKFAERLSELRHERGLSQRKLAQSVKGITHNAISLWEKNLRTPNIDAVIILAKFFGVTADYLIGMTDY